MKSYSDPGTDGGVGLAARSERADRLRAARVDRGARRREQTRTRLVDAARLLFARQGVDATRINEITEEADVGFGSFYNHFEGKEQIVEAVLEETLRVQAAAVDDVTRDLDDPAEVVAVAHRWFVALASSDPDWAWLLVRLDVSHDLAVAALGPFAERDLRRGLKAGRFDVPDATVALRAQGGALLAVMRAVLGGYAGRDVAEDHAAGVLRMLGLDRDEAAAVAARPMP
jgi:AcrR family transcriptional regulator